MYDDITGVEEHTNRQYSDTNTVLARSLRELRATIVHVPLYSRSSPYVRVAAILASTPLTVAHEWCRPTRPQGLRRWADRLLARHSRFAAASEAQARELELHGVEVVISEGGVHGSSMLDPVRTSGDVEPTWRAVLEFLSANL